ncbi:hypothetical protein [uncultured Zobellia sp.]|uniref:hypothetical protein n=1 Tax=uncultured Zobellia sp. TaxID=255433 RepID=UPI002599DA81|nr:hypothetical protein [uncultured Zobellia sp.]
MIRLILEYKDLFDDDQKDIHSYLDGIDRWTLIRHAIFFSSLSKKLKPELKYLFYPFLVESDKGSEFEFFLNDKIVKYIINNSGLEPVILNVKTSLKFFELVQNYNSVKNNSYSESEINKRLLKVYLILNENINQKEDSLGNTNETIISNALTHSVYSETNNSYLRIAEFKKACLFFEYCKLYLPNHYSLFLEDFSINDWQEYVNYIHQIGMLYYDSTSPVTSISIPKEDKNYQKKVDFFDKFCLSEIYQNDADFTNIKSRPVFKKEDTEEYFIIFEQFFLEKMFKSIYFTFNAINDKLKGTEVFIKNFKSDVGLFFSEKTLLNKIIKDALGNKYKHLGYEKLQKGGRPDYYIRNGKNIFLFECKDNLIKKSIVESSNIKQFVKELKNLFVENDKGQKKAIKQLISNIVDIRQGCFEEDQGINHKNNVIYPIIVTTNSIFSLPGVNLLLNEWFIDELRNSEIDNVDVKNITLININTLIVFSGLLKNNHLPLKVLIDSYWKRYQNFLNKKFDIREDIIFERYKVYMSFDNYIEQQNHGKYLLPNDFRQYQEYFDN